MSKLGQQSLSAVPCKFARLLLGALTASCALFAMPSMAEFAITSPADAAVFCFGDTLGAGQLTVYSDCAPESGTAVSASVGSASATMGGSTPNFANTQGVVLEEAGWITVTASDACGSSDTRDIAVVELESITVSGAIAVGGDNYVAVKTNSPSDYVYVIARCNPNDPSIALAVLTLEGGEVCIDPMTRAVPKNVSQKTTVTASVCGSSLSVNVWILWATLEIRNSGAKSSGNNKAFPSGWLGDGLGAYSDEDDGLGGAETTGKIEAVATLSPAGVSQIVPGGWDIKRWVISRHYDNGSLLFAHDQDDTSHLAFKDLVPDVDDKIYDIDGPTCGYNFNVNHTRESYDNFWQWVTWNETKCSDSFETWHYQARVDDDLDAVHRDEVGRNNDDTELNDVSWGMLTSLPATAYYPAR